MLERGPLRIKEVMTSEVKILKMGVYSKKKQA